MQYVCEKNNWDHPSDGPHGKGWNALRTEFSRGIGELAWACEETGATLLIIDHSKEELIETTTANITKVTCAMSGQARSVIMPVPDHIWFLGYADAQDSLKNVTEKRRLFISGSDKIEAGTRDTSISRRWISPLSATKPYQQIVKLLYGGTEE